jgi:hypothetical protein
MHLLLCCRPRAAAKDATIAGAQPALPSNSFESRFGAMK